jgi:hypothetical protein
VVGEPLLEVNASLGCARWDPALRREREFKIRLEASGIIDIAEKLRLKDL